MSLMVHAGIPDHWEQRYAEAPVFASRRWIDLGSVWYPGEILTFEGPDRSLAIVGTVIKTPLSAARRCPWAICSGSMSGQGFAVEGPHPWSGLAPGDVSPCLFLMFPYYLGDIVGGDARNPQALNTFIASCEGWARDHDCRSVAFMYGTAIREQAVALAQARYERVTITQRSQMRVSWSGWQGYLASLPNKRRQRILRDMTVIEAAGVRLAEEPMPDDTREIVEQRCNMLRKYGALKSVDDEAAMVERVAAMQPRDSITMMTARYQGELKSYMVFVRDGRQWTPILSGSDYSPESKNCYFATAFYLPASIAAQHRVDIIDYGAGAVQAKRLRGCEVSDLVAHVRLIA